MAANPKTELFETMAVERIERAQMINKGGKRGIVLSDLRKIISCILKGIMVVSAAIGVILSALASAGTFMGGSRVFMYEKMSDQVVATEELLREWIFEKRKAEVLFICEEEVEVGFALFFHNFSTFLGRAGIYLEDLYVLPEHRGKGYGKALLKKLARVAVERGCGRLEWWCLDWNRPSIDFYLSLGAEPMADWTVYRLTGETLKGMAK